MKSDVALHHVIGHYTPLTRKGEEWAGACPIAAHPEPLAVIGDRWRCYAGCHEEHGDDAAGFLKALGITEPPAEWVPTLLAPTPPPSRYAIARVTERPDATVLITQHRKAAAVAARLLPKYAAVAWPDGGSRWDGLEPLRGRAVLLWPSPEGLGDMERLEAVLCDPAGLNCTGKVVNPLDLTTWTGTAAELIAWAKANVRPMKSGPMLSAGTLSPNPAARVAPPSLATQGAGNVAADSTPPPESPPPPAGPDTAPEPEFPPEATAKRPKRARLSVVGNTALAVDPEAEPIPHELSESGIAAHFVMLHRDKYRAVFEWSGRHGPCWMAWDGSRWRREPNRITAMQDARTLGHGVKYWDAAKATSDAGRVKWESKKFLGAMLDLASYAPEFVANPEMFDADPYLLGTPAGTVDLRLGKILEPEREHYLTRQTSVSPVVGPHPLFDDVLHRAAGGDADITAYLWNWLGYLLTGLTKEKAFLYLFGKTDSGKTTLANALANIMGNSDSGGYAAQCDVEMFSESKMDKGNDRLAHLAGARFAYASEMEEGRNFKTALLKLATGTDSMKGRYLYSEEFTFQATHKLWIFGNHKMHMKSSDSALINRLHMLEYKDAFIVSAEERDNDFQDKLRAEYPAILHSMIQASLRYIEGGGLGRPETIVQAVEDYASNEDTLGQWIAECLDISTGARTPAAETYQCFSRWAEKEGAYVPSAKRFGQQLEDRGFGRARPGGVRSFVGFSIKVGANL